MNYNATTAYNMLIHINNGGHTMITGIILIVLFTVIFIGITITMDKRRK